MWTESGFNVWGYAFRSEKPSTPYPRISISLLPVLHDSVLSRPKRSRVVGGGGLGGHHTRYFRVPRGGYGGRDEPFQGVDIDIYAKGLAAEDDPDQRGVLITGDRVGSQTIFFEESCRRKKCGDVCARAVPLTLSRKPPRGSRKTPSAIARKLSEPYPALHNGSILE